MDVTLVEYTPRPDMVCNIAAKTCVSESVDLDEYDEECKSLKEAIRSGHTSVLEHASFTFYVSGISRACSHQLVRHRIASYAQQSQRYVDVSGAGYVIPPEIEKDKTLLEEYTEAMDAVFKAYENLVELGYAKKEDARYVLPNACKTNITMTMNGRELTHFLELRLCKRAQWEIRDLAEHILELVKDAAPIMFENAGPQCKHLGYCPESNSCGAMISKEKLLSGIVTAPITSVSPGTLTPASSHNKNTMVPNLSALHGHPLVWWVPGVSELVLSDSTYDPSTNSNKMIIKDTVSGSTCTIRVPNDMFPVSMYMGLRGRYASAFIEGFLRNLDPKYVLNIEVDR